METSNGVLCLEENLKSRQVVRSATQGHVHFDYLSISYDLAQLQIACADEEITV